VQSREDLIVGTLLLATGAVFLALELLGRGHRHDHSHAHGHDHSHPHNHEHSHPHGHSHSHPPDRSPESPAATGARARTARLLAFVVPFGAAASPDLTVLPVFLAAGALGPAAAVGTLMVFAVVTIGTIAGLTLLGAALGYQLRGAWIDRGANAITAVVLLLLGALIALGIL
jgi:ABC-type nickel/cobalt efflux system permease component RcnA